MTRRPLTWGERGMPLPFPTPLCFVLVASKTLPPSGITNREVHAPAEELAGIILESYGEKESRDHNVLRGWGGGGATAIGIPLQCVWARSRWT